MSRAKTTLPQVHFSSVGEPPFAGRNPSRPYRRARPAGRAGNWSTASCRGSGAPGVPAGAPLVSTGGAGGAGRLAAARNLSPWGWGKDILLVLLLSLALRLALWPVLPRESLVSDEPEYLAASFWLAQGRGFSFYAEWPWLRPPFYLLFLAPFLRLFGPTLTPIRLAQMLLSLAVPLLVYLLGQEMMGRRIALPAGLLAALWSPLAFLPHLLLAENLFLPLLLAAVWLLVRYQKTQDLRRLLAGGGFLGLATLTRGLTLGFLPLATLWMGWQAWQGAGRSLRRGLLSAALLVGAVLLLILPWSAYNALRYGRPILVDTTGGYNFWLGTQGGQFQDAHQVHQTLLDLPDPASRQAYAYRQGWQAIAADPAGFWRARRTEVGQLLRINYGADERLLDGFVLGEVALPHLLVVFFLEDTAYLLLLPLAILGLVLRKSDPGRGLVLLWLGYSLLVAVGFFAIARFRLPLLPFLALYAAVGLVEGWPRVRQALRQGWSGALRLAAALVLVVTFGAVVFPSYAGPYPASTGATWLGLQGRVAAGHLERAARLLAAGDLEAARSALRPALAYRPNGMEPVVTALVLQAELLRAEGDEAGALALLEGQTFYQAILLRADILRGQGREEQARALMGGRDLDRRNPTSWAWEHLRPLPARRVDLGGDLDLGLVDGFYPPEREGESTFRWSEETAWVRFPAAGSGRPLLLHLRLRGWRPAGEPPARFCVGLEAGEEHCLAPSTDWEEVAVPLPAVPAGEDVVVYFHGNTFLAGPRDLLESGRLRFLGVMVDRMEVTER